MPDEPVGALVPLPRLDLRIRNHRGTVLLGWRDTVVELDEVGAFLWHQVDGVRTVAEIAALVAAEYDADSATVLDDVTETLRDLAQANLVRLAAATQAAESRTWY